MFSLESPHRGDSNEYTQYTMFNIKKKITLNYSRSEAIGFFLGIKNQFETAVVNEPSVFEPLKFNTKPILPQKLCLYEPKLPSGHLVGRHFGIICLRGSFPVGI